jgi:hypothetical protein
MTRTVFHLAISLMIILMLACTARTAEQQSAEEALPLVGTWKLLTGTIIEQGDTLVTDYSVDKSFIKIINATHFAFTLHDLHQGKEADALFSSGAGRYTLDGDVYTEYLEYCTDRSWEGHTFSFTVTIRQDTLVQQGVERIESEGIDRINIERYVRLQ